jgi:hypothetical protein
MKHSLLFIAVLSFVTYYGCKSTSTSTPPGPTIVIPNVGSSWTLQNIHRDSTGKTVKTDTSTRTIAQTNMTIAPYSDVVMIVEYNSSTKIFDTVYIRYLSNGDLSRLSSPSLGVQPPVWLTIPYTTHLAQTYNFSGTASAVGFTHDTVAFSVSYLNNDNDTVAGVLYPVSIVTSTTWQQVSSATKDSTLSNTQTNSFIPSKGIFGDRNVTVNQVKGKNVQREQQILIGVSLK